MLLFSEVMDQAVVSQGVTTFNVASDWGQGRTIFGGMQGAMAVKTMRDLLGQDLPLRTLQVTFVGPVFFGDVHVRARILRQGKSAVHVQAEIFDDAAVRLTAIGIFGADRESEANDTPNAPACKRSLDEAKPIPYWEGLMPAFLQHFETRAAESIKLFSGTKHPRGVTYARHRDESQITEAHLVAMGDVAPPVAMAALTKYAPASSMNWQLDFVQQPSALINKPWFRVDAEAVASGNGYTWQNTNYWDQDGRLALLSRQCLAVFG